MREPTSLGLKQPAHGSKSPGREAACVGTSQNRQLCASRSDWHSRTYVQYLCACPPTTFLGRPQSHCSCSYTFNSSPSRAYRPACTIVFADVPTSFPTIYIEWRRRQTSKTNWRKQKESRLRASRNRRSARAPASCPRLQGPLRGDQPHVNISKLGPWCGRFGRAKAGMFTCRCVGSYGGSDPLSLLLLVSLSSVPARVNPG